MKKLLERLTALLVVSTLPACVASAPVSRAADPDANERDAAATSGSPGDSLDSAARADVAEDLAVISTPEAGSVVGRTDVAVIDDFEGGQAFPIMWSLTLNGETVQPAPATPRPPRATSRQALHLQGIGGVSGADLHTHQHFAWTALFTEIQFWARAPVARDVLFAVTDLRAPGTFSADLANGRPWMVKRVTVTSEWRQYTVALRDLMPAGPGEPVPMVGSEGGPPASALHFVLPDEGAFDVWLDDVEARCRDSGCAELSR